jgi:hypothetical protein
MKSIFFSLLAACLLVGMGCETKTSPGGPGVGAGSHKGGVGQPEDTFRLAFPDLKMSKEITLRQGQSHNFKVDIERGKGFDQDVKVVLSGMPKGVTIDPAEATIKSSDKDTVVKIEAAKDADLGKHPITVTGTPHSGKPVSQTFEIKIEAEKEK